MRYVGGYIQQNVLNNKYMKALRNGRWKEWCQAPLTVETYLEKPAVAEPVDPPSIIKTAPSKP